jgi:hypothetical protein
MLLPCRHRAADGKGKRPEKVDDDKQRVFHDSVSSLLPGNEKREDCCRVVLKAGGGPAVRPRRRPQ